VDTGNRIKKKNNSYNYLNAGWLGKKRAMRGFRREETSAAKQMNRAR